MKTTIPIPRRQLAAYRAKRERYLEARTGLDILGSWHDKADAALKLAEAVDMEAILADKRARQRGKAGKHE